MPLVCTKCGFKTFFFIFTHFKNTINSYPYKSQVQLNCVVTDSSVSKVQLCWPNMVMLVAAWWAVSTLPDVYFCVRFVCDGKGIDA